MTASPAAGAAVVISAASTTCHLCFSSRRTCVAQGSLLPTLYQPGEEWTPGTVGVAWSRHCGCGMVCYEECRESTFLFLWMPPVGTAPDTSQVWNCVSDTSTDWTGPLLRPPVTPGVALACASFAFCAAKQAPNVRASPASLGRGGREWLHFTDEKPERRAVCPELVPHGLRCHYTSGSYPP